MQGEKGTWQPEKTLQVHSDWVCACTLSPDGQVVASGSDDKYFRLVDVNSGAQLFSFKHSNGLFSSHAPQIRGAAWAPHGRSVAVSTVDGAIFVVSQESGRWTHNQVYKQKRPFYNCVFTPNGRFLAVGSEEKCTLVLDAANGYTVAHLLGGFSVWVWCVDVSPDGALMACGSGDSTVGLFAVSDSGEWARKATLTYHSKAIRSIAFSPAGDHLAVGSNDGTVSLWPVPPPGEAWPSEPLRTLSGHSGAVQGLAFTYDGSYLVSGSFDKSVRVWRVYDGTPVGTLSADGHIDALALHAATGRLAAGVRNVGVQLWRTQPAPSGGPLPLARRAAAAATAEAAGGDDDADLARMLGELGIAREVAAALRRDHVTSEDLVAAARDGGLERLLREEYGVAALKARSIQARVGSAAAPARTGKAEIAMADLLIGAQVLGRGSFGTVVQGTFRGAAVAVKGTENATPSERADLLAEAALLAGMGAHPNVVQFIGAAVRPTDNAVFIVTELCDGGDLLRALRDGALRSAWTASARVAVLADVARGMWHLAGQNIVHRDLAARNVLLSRRSGDVPFIAKVSDFGLSRADAGESLTMARPRPIAWTAPEGFASPPRLTSASDVWSFGVLAWEVATRGASPFEGVQNVRAAVMAGQRPQPTPADCGQAEQWLMEACAARDPNERPTFEAICKRLVELARAGQDDQLPVYDTLPA